jgi:FKBP-type peptidyl-prolyl cis-trans isomerase FklB
MNTKVTAVAVFSIFTTAGMLSAAGADTFTNELDKVSYAIGLNFGGNWKRQEVEVNYEYLVRGLKDSAGDGEKLMTDEEIRDTLNKYQQTLIARQQEKRRELAEKNKKMGDEFLAENKSKPGVVTTASGLQYKVIAAGEGDSPKAEDTVTVNYRGTLIDGTEFDKSASPVPVRVNGVFPGWSEALQLMKPGAKWELVVPPNLAFGEGGNPPRVGPNAALKLEVELVSIQPAPQRAPLTSDIIKVPSLEEMKKGAKIETIKAEDLEKLQKQEQQKSN